MISDDVGMKTQWENQKKINRLKTTTMKPPHPIQRLNESGLVLERLLDEATVPAVHLQNRIDVQLRVLNRVNGQYEVNPILFWYTNTLIHQCNITYNESSRGTGTIITFITDCSRRLWY